MVKIIDFTVFVLRIIFVIFLLLLLSGGGAVTYQAGQASNNASIASSSPPAAVSWGWNHLDIFLIGNNNRLYHKAWNGTDWYPSLSGFESLGGNFIKPQRPAVVSCGLNRIDIFLIGNNDKFYHKSWNGTDWYPSVTEWESLGGNFKKQQQPTVVSWGWNRTDIFLTGNNNKFYHKSWNGTDWYPSVTGWESLGGSFKKRQQPTVVSWGLNPLDIFLIGNNKKLYHKAWNGTDWYPSATGWESLGGNFKKKQQPTIVTWGANPIDIFLIGNNNKLYHKAWNGTDWYPSETGWESLGGNFKKKQQPTIVKWGMNRLDIFLIGNNKKLYHKAWNGTDWHPSVTGWESLGGSFKRGQQPTVVSWGLDRLDIFLIGKNKKLYHKAWNGTDWYPSVTGWKSLGGNFKKLT